MKYDEVQIAIRNKEFVVYTGDKCVRCKDADFLVDYLKTILDADEMIKLQNTLLSAALMKGMKLPNL